ncbi:MAG: alpha/beta hydrolase, partial [Mycobacterium sp.]
MTVRPATRFRGPTITSRAKWLLRARPGDYMLALSDAMASLPVVGRHLEPLGGVAAMSVWGYRQVPGFVTASAKSWLSPGIGEIRKA